MKGINMNYESSIEKTSVYNSEKRAEHRAIETLLINQRNYRGLQEFWHEKKRSMIQLARERNARINSAKSA